MKPAYLLGGLAALVGAIGLSIGGYQLGWWIKEDSVNRRAEINQDGYGRPNALVEQILDDVEEAQDPALPLAQRAALVDIICDSAAKLTGSIALPSYAARFVSQECPS